MLVRHISKDDLWAAAAVASRSLGNEIILEDLRPTNRQRTSWRFRIKVLDLGKPGHRIHLHSYVLGAADKPRRSRHLCAHGHAHPYTAIFERSPNAVIRTALATYKGSAHFLSTFEDVMERNVGSRYYPVRFADSCSCPSDDVPTDTIEPWTWRLGEPELPTPEGVNHREEVILSGGS
jgi:hypothetical protein